MSIKITAFGKDLKNPYDKTFPRATDALEKFEFLAPIAAKIEIRDEDGGELSEYALRMRAQTELDGYL